MTGSAASEGRYDILVFCSDQHSAGAAGFMGDPLCQTPELDRIAASGMVFDNAYTACPLCVPARAALMTARMPSRLGVFDNQGDYRSSEVTFAHLHALAGYQSVLIGRMHFVGMDFRHGFTRRLGKDFTGSYWGYSAACRPDLREYAKGLRQQGCLELIGNGDTPVREYDRQVTAAALDYLSRDHDRPQLIVVGTYGPHFPYIADGPRMDRLRPLVQSSCQAETLEYQIPPLLRKVQEAPWEDIVELRCAYYALIEEMDQQIGQVYGAFRRYLNRTGRKGVFVYLSDHGDQIGYKGLYGKQTFFERSAKIPLVFAGDGIGRGRSSASVSIMDVGPTLCQLNQTPPFPSADGISLAPALRGGALEDRQAVAEFYETLDGVPWVGRMIHQDGKKFIRYSGGQEHVLLFDTERDPGEERNLAGDYPGLCAQLGDRLNRSPAGPDRRADYQDCLERYRLLSRLGPAHPEWNPDTFTASERVRHVRDPWRRPAPQAEQGGM